MLFNLIKWAATSVHYVNDDDDDDDEDDVDDHNAAHVPGEPGIMTKGISPFQNELTVWYR